MIGTSAFRDGGAEENVARISVDWSVIGTSAFRDGGAGENAARTSVDWSVIGTSAFRDGGRIFSEIVDCLLVFNSIHLYLLLFDMRLFQTS